MTDLFGHEADILEGASAEQHGPFEWQVIQTSKASTTGKGANFVKGFLTRFNGHTYYGYARAGTAAAAKKYVDELLGGAAVPLTRSLTGDDYTGKKYYFGWGAAGFGDPQMMHNEVKYDVLHTHDIFTKDVGGNYIGTQMIGTSTSG